jgi:hypothetical protein
MYEWKNAFLMVEKAAFRWRRHKHKVPRLRAFMRVARSGLPVGVWTSSLLHGLRRPRHMAIVNLQDANRNDDDEASDDETSHD